MKFILVLTTCPNTAMAQKIARHILKKRLAACVQITGPVKSIYRWKSRIESAKEVQLWIKTRASCFQKLKQEISLHHSYEVPEIISISIRQGLKDYLRWVESETQN